ncbi:MAG: hypothetical protein AAFQ63_23950, partial [Cyanobacteria bacterium J06621_11]
PSESVWSDAHASLVKHFDRCFKFIAEGNCNPEAVAYKKAVSLLCFREPSELCLGYTHKGTSGSGSGYGYALTIAAAITAAIHRGVECTNHFEELGIINEGIGSDRISDITCNILKARLVKYTQEVAVKHGIETAMHDVWAAGFDDIRQRWTSDKVALPTNPFTNNPVILVPRRFLRDLPQLNYQDWWEWYENEQLRTDINYEILGSVDKKTIVETAKANISFVQKYVDDKESEPPDPYDFKKDRNGVWVWKPATSEYVDKHPIELNQVQDDDSFDEFIGSLLDSFRHFVEEAGGWKLLWNDNGKEKPESAAQLLFRGIAEHYCQAANVVIDREVELGRGPVDFKFSQGYARRALLEVKKAHNGKYWHGLEEQLPSYLRSDKVSKGWFLAIKYRDNGSSVDRIVKLPQRVDELQTRLSGVQLRPFVVNALPKLSASNI